MKIEYLNYSCDINDDKVYLLPNDIIIKECYNYYIYISPKNGNWIVLENDVQQDIINKLIDGETVATICTQFSQNMSDINYVLAQIEGRHFEYEYIENDNFFNLRIYLTNNCNLRCSHCFMYADKAFNNELSVDEIIMTIEKAAKVGAQKLILTGGEVCLSKALIPALECAKLNGMSTQVLTNGTLLNDELFKKTLGLIDEVQISIDGFNEEVNSQIRGRGAFDKALSTVEKFVYSSISTSIIITPLYGYIEKYYDEYLSFTSNLVEKYKNYDFLIIFGNELIDGRNVKASPERNVQYSETVKRICEDLYPNSELTTFVMNHKENFIYKNCGYGSLTVNSNGDFYFCGRIYEVKKYGNIRTMDFDDIIKLRSKARQYSCIDNFYPCKICDLRYICGGGCRISNYREITQVSNLFNFNIESLPHRKCTNAYKENLYRLMLESSDFLLW